MSTLKVSYELLQHFLESFREVGQSFARHGGSLAPTLNSKDPVAARHASIVRPAEERIVGTISHTFELAAKDVRTIHSFFKEADLPAGEGLRRG
jgi:hypothetical protein